MIIQDRDIPKISVVLDIDNTLATGLIPAKMQFYNERLSLDISPSDIVTPVPYNRAFRIPVISNYRHGRDRNGSPIPGITPEIGERQFQQVRREFLVSPEIHLSLNELPGSVEGAIELAQVANGDLSYYSARPPEIEEVTREWLINKRYPNPDRLILCQSPEDKLRRIITDKLSPFAQEETLPQVVIFDDSYEELAQASRTMVTQDSSLKGYFESILLVGFGMDPNIDLEGSFYPQSGIRTLALPSWQREHVAQVVQKLTN